VAEVRQAPQLLAAPLRSALVSFCTLGRITPPQLQLLLDEVDLAVPAAARPLPDLTALAGWLGPRAAEPLDDPMRGLVSGTVHRALLAAWGLGSGRKAPAADGSRPTAAARGQGLLAALDFLAGLGDQAGSRAINEWTRLAIEVRHGLLGLALRIAGELPTRERPRFDPAGELFASFRERSRVPLLVTAPDGGLVQGFLPNGTRPPTVAAARRLCERVLYRFAALVAAPGEGRDQATAALAPGFAEPLVASLLGELHDALVGLLLETPAATPAAPCGLDDSTATEPNHAPTAAACPHASASLRATLVDAGSWPTRARHGKQLELAGKPFRDPLGRFFAAPSKTLALPRTHRSIVVWQLGSCPFPDLAWMAASDDPAHPAWLP
jgi:hypothetical protein